MFSFSGNWVDLIILIVTAFLAVDGLRLGLVRGLLGLGSLVFSFASSLRFYSFFGQILIANFSLPRGIANTLGFLLAGIITQTLFTYLTAFIYAQYQPRKNKNPETFSPRFSHRLNSFLGIIPAALESLIYIAFILSLLVSLPVQGNIKKAVLSSRIGSSLIASTSETEKQLNSIFGPAISDTLNFITINPDISKAERVDLKFAQKEVTVDEAAEKTMFALINSERSKVGLRPLLLSASLTSLARSYGKDMFARGYFSHYNPEGHSPFDRMHAAGITFVAAGENLALAPNVQIAHQGLMNSPGHRANILSPDFGRVGIGAIDGGIYGEIFVQEFTN